MLSTDLKILKIFRMDILMDTFVFRRFDTDSLTMTFLDRVRLYHSSIACCGHGDVRSQGQSHSLLRKSNGTCPKNRIPK